MEMEENIIENKYCNYSKKDGKINARKNNNYFTIEKENINYCPKCESLVNKKDIYCKNCGQILENVKSKREKFINQQEERSNLNNIISSFDLITGLKTSVVALVILYIFSVIIKLLIVGGNDQISQLINPVHIMLFGNMATVDIIMSLFMNSSQSSVNFGFLLLLILPVVSFILSYRLFMKKRNTSFLIHLKNSLSVALIYALLLVVLAKFSQVEVSLSSGFGQYGYGIYLGFSTISTFIKGFIIGFISILFIGLKKEYEKENSIVYAIKLSLKVILGGYVLTLIILSLLNFANINYIYELGLNNYISNTSMAVVLSQIAVYLWAYSNLIPVHIGSMTISLISLFKSSLSLDITLLLGALIALSALIFIIVGCKLESKYKSKDIKPVVIFSASYAAIMGAIGLLTTLYIGDNAASMLSSISAMQMGFNFIMGIIMSFVYSFVMTLVGYKLNIFNYLEGKDERYEVI